MQKGWVKNNYITFHVTKNCSLFPPPPSFFPAPFRISVLSTDHAQTDVNQIFQLFPIKLNKLYIKYLLASQEKSNPYKSSCYNLGCSSLQKNWVGFCRSRQNSLASSCSRNNFMGYGVTGCSIQYTKCTGNCSTNRSRTVHCHSGGGKINKKIAECSLARALFQK